MVAHAAVRGIGIKSIGSSLEGEIDLRGVLGLSPSVPKGYTAIRVAIRIDANLKDLNRIRELAEFSPVFNTLTQGTHVAVTSVRSRGPRRGSRLEGRTGSGPARRDALLQDPTPISSTF